MSRARLIVCVLLPFAAGYYLSYLFRTINALIAGDLAAELNLTAADLGFLTSIYFLVFAAAQLPFGALLDRHGPKIIQSALLLLASAGALLFALADGLLGLVVGRALVGLGVALALMAGFKAIVVWFPPERVALANGWLVMLGALGAVTATAPAELVVQCHWLARAVRCAGGVVGAGRAAGSVRRARAGLRRPSQEHRAGHEPSGDLPGSTLLARCSAVRDWHRHILVATRPVGRSLAS